MRVFRFHAASTKKNRRFDDMPAATAEDVIDIRSARYFALILH